MKGTLLKATNFRRNYPEINNIQNNSQNEEGIKGRRTGKIISSVPNGKDLFFSDINQFKNNEIMLYSSDSKDSSDEDDKTDNAYSDISVSGDEEDESSMILEDESSHLKTKSNFTKKTYKSTRTKKSGKATTGKNKNTIAIKSTGSNTKRKSSNQKQNNINNSNNDDTGNIKEIEEDEAKIEKDILTTRTNNKNKNNNINNYYNDNIDNDNNENNLSNSPPKTKQATAVEITSTTKKILNQEDYNKKYEALNNINNISEDIKDIPKFGSRTKIRHSISISSRYSDSKPSTVFDNSKSADKSTTLDKVSKFPADDIDLSFQTAIKDVKVNFIFYFI
jgi:hypothetical protein